MALGNCLDDGQPQAAAAGGGAVGAAHEAGKDTFALGRGDARAGVVHTQQPGAGLGQQRHLHRAAGRTVAQRVVHQIAGQHSQGIRVAVDAGRLERGIQVQLQPAAARLGQCAQVGQHLAQQRRQGHRGEGHGRRARLAAGQGQQLLDQPGGAVHAGHQGVQRGLAAGIVGSALQALRLQFERGQRRAQFVRGVGDKGALTVQRLAQAGEQGVERMHQGCGLGRQIGLGQGRQGVGIALAYLLGQAGQRPQRAPDQGAHGQRQQRRHGQQRHHAAPGRVGRQALANARWLGDLDHPVARADRKAAPALAVDRDVGKTQHRAGRQAAVGARGIDAAPIKAPDLHHKVQFFVVEGAGLAGRDLALVAQRQSHLAQLVVEQRLGLAQHAAVGGATQRGGSQQQRRRHRGQQAGADRAQFHGAGGAGAADAALGKK